MTRYELTSAGGSFDVDVTPEKEGFRIKLDDTDYVLKLRPGDEQNSFIVEFADKPVSITLLEASSQRVGMILNGERIFFHRSVAAIGHTPAREQSRAAADLILAAMPGKVVGSLVKKGERVKVGDPLVILESMKMEIAVRSDRDAVVREILVAEGDSVRRGQGLVRLDA